MAKGNPIKEDAIKEQSLDQEKQALDEKEQPIKQAEPVKSEPAPEPEAVKVDQSSVVQTESNAAENDLVNASKQEEQLASDKSPDASDEPASDKDPEPAKPVEKDIEDQPQAGAEIKESPVSVAVDQIETPAIDQKLIDDEDAGAKDDQQPDPENQPTLVTVATQVEVEDLGEPAAEQPLDIFEEVASGDGDVSDPSKQAAKDAVAPESGDGDASDPSKPSLVVEKPVASGDPDAGDPVKPAPDNVDAVASGDGDVSDPSKTGDADGTEPTKVDPGIVNLQDSGDGDVSDPSKKGDADAGDPINAIPEIDDLAESGDGDVTDPVKPAPGTVDLAASGDADAGDPDPVKPAPFESVSDKSELTVESDANSDHEDSKDEAEPAAAQLDGQNVPVADVSRIDIDAERVSAVHEQLVASIAESGHVVDQDTLGQLLGSSSIKPDAVSLVSGGVAQPVEITEHKDGSFTVTERELDKTSIRAYDANGNLVTEQIDKAHGTVIIDHSVEGTVTNTLIFDDGVTIVAVHNDDGSGSVEITDENGETSTATIDPFLPDGDGDSDDSQGSDSGDQDDSGSSSSDDDDDSDDKNDSESDSSQPDDSSDDDSDSDSDSNDGKGTPNPIDDGGDGPPLVFVTDGRIGRQDHEDTERGIDAAAGGGHTDPVDQEDAEATLEFLVSELGQDQHKDNEQAVEDAQGGSHTDPAEGEADSFDVLTDDELEHIEFMIAGGGLSGPDDSLADQDSASIQDSVKTVQDEFDAIADATASLVDALDLQIEVNVEDLDDDF